MDYVDIKEIPLHSTFYNTHHNFIRNQIFVGKSLNNFLWLNKTWKPTEKTQEEQFGVLWDRMNKSEIYYLVILYTVEYYFRQT